MAPHSTGGDTLVRGARDTFRTFAWLGDDPRPLDWNGPADRLFTRFRDEDLQRSIIEHFERVARRQRGRIAIRDADTALTYGELWDGVSRLAETLSAETKPGDLIGILLPACPMFPLAMLACLASGRPFVALDTHYPPDWLDRVLQDARPALIITLEDGWVPGVDARLPALRVIRLTGMPGSAHNGWRPASPTKFEAAGERRWATMGVDEPACVLFTSGSTGRPKSIVNSQRNLLQRVAQSINAAHINTADRLLTLASPSTIVGVRDVMTALLAGASIHLLDPLGVGAREIRDAIRTEAITILFAFPALLRSIVPARGERVGASLRLVRIGGDTTLWSDIDTLRAWLAPEAAIQLIYAATEAPMLQWFVDDRCRQDDARIPIGYPLPGNRLALVDSERRGTPPGEVGELIVASPYVSLGSWVGGRLADESVERGGARMAGFSHRRPRAPAARRVAGASRPQGQASQDTRVSRRSRWRRSHASRTRIRARCGRDRTAGQRRWHVTLVAYVSARDRAPSELIDELRGLMRSAPPPMRPARFYLAPSIPRLPSSKLDIRALAALDEAQVHRERAESIDEATLTAIATDDHVSQTVARIWKDVLRVPVRAPEDDFFDSGGDSLSAVTFVLELERALHVEISLTLINEAPRFDQLCHALRERRAPGSTPLITLKEGDGLPPIFFIHGVGGNLVEILPTARRVTYPGAVIGVRARGVVRGETPHTSIEEMAADYLREIKKRQPNGPYYLCGYSSGGLAAFEIARRLSEVGR